MAERLQRLFPVNYWSYIKRQTGKEVDPKRAAPAGNT
jgi:hypothetical protein